MQETPKNYTQQQEENLFQDLLKKYLPYWPLFAVSLAIAIAGAYLYLRYQVPHYQANATLLIKDEMKGTFDQSDVLQSLNMFGSNKLVENEMDVIQSRTLAKEVVRNLHLYAPVFSKGRVRDHSAYTGSPVTIHARYPDSLEASDPIFFNYDYGKDQITIEGKRYALNQWYRFPYGELMFTKNPHDASGKPSPKPLYFYLVDVKSAAAGLLGSIKVTTTNKMGSVLNVVVNDASAKRAEVILNELIAVYTKAAINDKNKLASNTLKFVDERLRFVVEELDSVEHRVERFKASNKVVDISTEGKLFLEGVSQNDQHLSEMNMKMAVLDQVEKYVVSKDNKAGIVPSTLGVNDPVLLQLLNGLYDAETKYENLRKTTADNYPTVVALADQIEKMRGNIMENIRNQRQGMVASRQEIYATNNKFSSLLSSLPQKERELVDISRQQAIKNNIYTFLLQKREETALSTASTVSDIRIVDEAESDYAPIGSNKKIIYLLSIFAALGFCIGVVTLRDALNRSVMLREEVEKNTAVPILGEVAQEKSSKAIVIGEGKRTFVAEQFRHLRTYLGYLGINSRKKKILITSTITGEGKSFITANLGISLALMGKKVVLLELDLRKPKLSEALNVAKGVGISNFLIGDKSAVEIIKSTAVNPNLFVVPSGPIPPNPSELLLNGRLAELFDFLDASFDYILIDTAPVNPVTDAFILMPMVDATLYVVRQGYTPKAAIPKLDELYRHNGERSMAIVFNGVKARGLGSYGYGYGYGYGYTAEEDKKEKKRGKIFS